MKIKEWNSCLNKIKDIINSMFFHSWKSLEDFFMELLINISSSLFYEIKIEKQYIINILKSIIKNQYQNNQ